MSSSSTPARRGKLIKVVMGSDGKTQHAGSSQPTRPGVVILPRNGGGQSKPGVVFLPKSQGGAAAVLSRPTRPSATAALPPTLTPDQLLLCRHLVNAHMVAKGEAADVPFAQATLDAIDATLALLMEQPVMPVASTPKAVTVTGNRSQGALSAVSPRGVPSAPSTPAVSEAAPAGPDDTGTAG